jgi:hypothetical protein
MFSLRTYTTSNPCRLFKGCSTRRLLAMLLAGTEIGRPESAKRDGAANMVVANSNLLKRAMESLIIEVMAIYVVTYGTERPL